MGMGEGAGGFMGCRVQVVYVPYVPFSLPSQTDKPPARTPHCLNCWFSQKGRYLLHDTFDTWL